MAQTDWRTPQMCSAWPGQANNPFYYSKDVNYTSTTSIADDVEPLTSNESDNILDRSGSLNELVSDILNESTNSVFPSQPVSAWPVSSSMEQSSHKETSLMSHQFWLGPKETLRSLPTALQTSNPGLQVNPALSTVASNNVQWPYKPLSGYNFESSERTGSENHAQHTVQLEAFQSLRQPETSSYADVARGTPNSGTAQTKAQSSMSNPQVGNTVVQFEPCTSSNEVLFPPGKVHDVYSRAALPHMYTNSQMITREHLELLRKIKLGQQQATFNQYQNSLKQSGRVFPSQNINNLLGNNGQWQNIGQLSSLGDPVHFHRNFQNKESLRTTQIAKMIGEGAGTLVHTNRQLRPVMTLVPAAYKDFPQNRHLPYQHDPLASQQQYAHKKYENAIATRPIPNHHQVLHHGDNAFVLGNLTSTLEQFIHFNHVELQNLETERRKYESDLSKLFPGQRISSSNSIPSFQLPDGPTKVDLLICDIDKEYHKVTTLTSKIGGLRKEGLHPDVESSLDKWLEAIQSVTGHRKAEIAHSYRKLSPESVRQLYSQENSLITKLQNLVECTRMARTSLWLATLFVIHNVPYQLKK